jgi:ribonuclease Z
VYHFHNYINNEIIFEDDLVQVKTVVLNHRIPCCGFVFSEKEKPGKIKKEAITKYNIPIDKIASIKNGEDFTTVSGETILNSSLTVKGNKPRSYAYCSDTIYDERIIDVIKNVDLLYHEATFMHELLSRAKSTYHTTALQAGTIAKKAEVGKLIIGHYSARYHDLQPLLNEAKSVFENTVLAIEGEKLKL